MLGVTYHLFLFIATLVNSKTDAIFRSWSILLDHLDAGSSSFLVAMQLGLGERANHLTLLAPILT